MLGKPVAEISETLSVLCEIDCLTQCVGSGGSGANRRQVENRKRNHVSGETLQQLLSHAFIGEKAVQQERGGEHHVDKHAVARRAVRMA